MDKLNKDIDNIKKKKDQLEKAVEQNNSEYKRDLQKQISELKRAIES